MEKDLLHKRCIGDNVRYADLLNGLLFDGQEYERQARKIGKKVRSLQKSHNNKMPDATYPFGGGIFVRFS